MKKFIFFLAVIISSSALYAQQCQKVCKKDKYVEKGDLIEATIYHDNGQIAQIGYLTKSGKLQGEWTSFSTKGEKTANAHYNYGKKVGTWQFYNGDEIKEVTYMNSKISKVKTWQSGETDIVSN